jgi:hypothetical protein
VGLPAEPPVIPLRSRAGLALPVAIFGMVVVSLITAGVFTMSDLDNRATSNRVETAAALRLAQIAETHALSLLRTRMKDTTFNRLLRGFDNTANTADDGLLTGYPGLGDSLNIPATGRVTAGGTYFVQIVDDPKDGNGLPFVDSNMRLRLRCRGVTPTGASADINVIVSNFTLPGLAVDGNLEVSSQLKLMGSCGGIHANGNLTGGGAPSVTTIATASGTTTLNVSPRASNQPLMAIPDLNPADFCGNPNYVYITNALWKPTSANIASGKVYCVNGNVETVGDIGSAASPRIASIIATGSIKISGKVFLKAAHPDGIVLMAGGDFDNQGDAGYEGLIYAGAQCYISSKPIIFGQVICKNKSPHPGENWVPFNLISGDAQITFGCNSMLSNSWRVVSWYPTIGS